jgi:hypothetical protein
MGKQLNTGQNNVLGTGFNIFSTENQHSKMDSRAFAKFGFLANMAHKMAI